MHKRAGLLAVVLGVSLALACSSGTSTTSSGGAQSPDLGAAEVKVQKDPKADFTGWGTYSWFPLAGEAGERSTAGSQIILDVDRILAAKGYTRIKEGTPDFKIACWTGLNEGWAGVPVGYIYPYYWTPIYVPKEYGKGFLALDLVDGKTNALSWRGNFSRAFTDHALSNETILRSAVSDAVTKILKDFPARTKA
ncbi:MAG TPA: DUF4136 domain-containing protein [Thermoanaerobaculia bacterium]|jgi:hypothetical protein